MLTHNSHPIHHSFLAWPHKNQNLASHANIKLRFPAFECLWICNPCLGCVAEFIDFSMLVCISAANPTPWRCVHLWTPGIRNVNANVAWSHGSLLRFVFFLVCFCPSRSVSETPIRVAGISQRKSWQGDQGAGIQRLLLAAPPLPLHPHRYVSCTVFSLSHLPLACWWHCKAFRASG